MRGLLAFLLLSSLLPAQANPDRRAILQQGRQLVEEGNLPAAQALYEKALGSDADDPDIRFELGMIYFREKNWRIAAENFKASLSSGPKIKPLYYLAESYFMQSDLDRARQTIAQAANIAPDDPQICQKYGEYLTATIETRKQGLDMLLKARRLNPGLPRIDFEIGKTQLDLTDFQSAAASLDTAVKKNLGDGQASFYLAEAYANLNDWETARDNYKEALARAYANGPTYYGLGRALVELGQFDAAIIPLQRAVALQPSLIQAHFQLGRAYRQLRQTAQAQHEMRLFSAMTGRVDTSADLKGPEEEEAWKRVKPLLAANHEQDALQLLANLPVAKLPDRGEPHYLLGTMYYSMGRKDDAKRMLSVARTRAPKSARIAAFLGMVELSSGETPEAEQAFQSALALDSSETLALIGMGSIRYQQQRWPEAVHYLEKSRTADPGALLMLCNSYFRAGRNDDALLAAEVIQAFAADKPTILDELQKLVKLQKSDSPKMQP
ncbi:MAG TPA: tetratricopeptide repeat protein [Candidatus Eisenbacteria bacterium]|nr:tetratricopeptide repeat protein [Candidatus Eisenbacteria bacterium]